MRWSRGCEGCEALLRWQTQECEDRLAELKSHLYRDRGGDVELERPCSQATLLTQPVRAVTATELVGVSVPDTGS